MSYVMMERRPRRWRRRLIVLTAVLSLIVAAVFFGVPWWLGTNAGRDWLVSRGSAALAPARLEVERFSFSWLGPTRMTGFVVRDEAGDAVVSAPVAEWDRTLWQALFDRPRYGTLRLNGATLDIERDRDGNVDIAEALAPILVPNPKASVAVRVDSGRLRFRSPELAAPVEAKDVELAIDRPADPAAITWRLRMSSTDAPAAGALAGRFESDGQIEKTTADVNERAMKAAVRTWRWPIRATLGATGIAARGTLETRTEIERRGEKWQTSGNAVFSNLALAGAPLKGDTPNFERVEGTWRLNNDGSGWRADAVDLSAPGLSMSMKDGQFEGRADLALLAEKFSKTLALHNDLHVERGIADLRISSAKQGDATDWRVAAQITDLAARRGDTPIALDAPATLSARVRETRAGLELAEFGIESKFMNATGHGDVDRGIVVEGTVDLAEFSRQLRTFANVDTWDASGAGQFTARYQRDATGAYTGGLSLDLRDLHVDAPAGATGWAVPEAMHVDASVAGASDRAGWPVDWKQAKADLKSESATAELDVKNGASEIDVVHAVAMADVLMSGKPMRAEVSLDAKRDAKGWEISEARGALSTKGNAFGWPKPQSIDLALSGRYDDEGDVLTLTPQTEGANRVLAVGREGLRIAGLRGGALQGTGELIFDIGEWEAFAEAASIAPKSGWSGIVVASGRAEPTENGVAFHGQIQSDDLRRIDNAGDEQRIAPLHAQLDATHVPSKNQLDIQSIALSFPFGSANASGTVADLTTARVVDVKGRFEPNWDAINKSLAEEVEPNARISGEPREFWVRGPLGGSGSNDLAAEIGVNLTGLDVYGMRFGATPIVVRWSEGAPSIDPIDTTLNGGRVHVVPELTRLTDGGPWTLGFAPGSGIDNATVNDEVSHRVLAFVAPPLDRATRVNGAVSARFDKVAIPLAAGAADDAIVEGTVLFHDVRFEPGPMAMRLYNMVGMEPMTLRLDQPVVLAIADGVVHQRGFSLPLGRVAHVMMDGAVGFDRSLALDVRVPLSGEQFASVPVFNRIAPAMRLEFPIRGTLDDPKIDGQAMGDAMGQVGLDVAQAAGFGGIEALVRQMSTPRDPAEEARLQAEREERQRIRREKQAQKKEEARLKREARKAARLGNGN